MIVDYRCPLCNGTRTATLLGVRQEDHDAWYLCFCRGKNGAGTRMTHPLDTRDPGPIIERKKPGRKSKIGKEPHKLEKAKAFGVMTPDMN